MLYLFGMVALHARKEVSELLSSMVDAGGGLPLPEDRLLTIMDAAQVAAHLHMHHFMHGIA